MKIEAFVTELYLFYKKQNRLLLLGLLLLGELHVANLTTLLRQNNGALALVLARRKLLTELVKTVPRDGLRTRGGVALRDAH